MFRENRRRETLGHTVVQRHGFLDLRHRLLRGGVGTPVPDDIQDRGEGFLLDDLVLVLCRSDAWCDVESAGVIRAFQRLAAIEDFSTLGDDSLHGVLHVVYGLLVHHRPHDDVAVTGISDSEAPVCPHQAPDQLVLEGVVHDDAPGSGAPLSCGPHGPEEDGRKHQLHIGVRRDNDGIVPAQLQDRAAETTTHHGGHPIPHLTASSGGHQRDLPVVEEPVAHRGPLPHRQREDRRIHVVLQTDLLGDPGHRDGGERRLAGGLPNRAVSAYRRQGGIPAPHRHREVERRDHSNDAQRMPLLEHPVIGALGPHRESVELAGEAGCEVADVDHLLHLSLTLCDHLPHLNGDELAQRRFVLPELVSQLADHFAPPRGRDTSPHQEGLVGPLHDLVVLLLRHLLHGGELRAVDWSEDVQLRARANPLTCEAAVGGLFDSQGFE